jgi:hypothetical protein
MSQFSPASANLSFSFHSSFVQPGRKINLCGGQLVGGGVDLNHRPLGYEPTGNRNYNNLQDVGGPRKTL